MDDPDSLKTALKGAYAVFLVTNYWETMDGEMETKQGMNVANAAKVCAPKSTNMRLVIHTFYRKPMFSISFSAVCSTLQKARLP